MLPVYITKSMYRSECNDIIVSMPQRIKTIFCILKRKETASKHFVYVHVLYRIMFYITLTFSLLFLAYLFYNFCVNILVVLSALLLMFVTVSVFYF